MNIEKTNNIVFSNKHGYFVASIGINNINFQRIYSTKFIGVFLDHELTLKKHMNYECGKNM